MFVTLHLNSFSNSAFREFSISLRLFTLMTGRLNFLLSIPLSYLHWPLEVVVRRIGVLMRQVSSTSEKYDQLFILLEAGFLAASNLRDEESAFLGGLPKKGNFNNHSTSFSIY